ncbi:extracellular exonuclease ExeM [uncultured Shewanella sp.]|uniref:extracellular exonuclease ExeM n=1 Tax=Shewanella atlantica TaxID=271099 RepID=UPI00260A1027|nr:extracellular exonuclease ExeM [uncultured Shewanella sp.]
MDNVKKLSVLALSIAAAMPMMASADVMISEYVEGSSNNKAIELYNTGDASVDLAGYKLVRFKDGAETSLDLVSLDGQAIASKSVKVITHPSATISLGSDVDSMTGNLYFNGGDAVALLKDGVIVDVIGTIPTPDGWGYDKTFQRNDDVTAAKDVFDAAQWTELAKDTFNGLGVRSGEYVGAEVEPYACTGDATAIYDIQGDGQYSPLTSSSYPYESADAVVVKGVVTARLDKKKGFFIQDVAGDGSAATSDGIFVSLGEVAPEEVVPGKLVCVEGKVKENYKQTEIVGSKDKLAITGDAEIPAVSPLVIEEGETLADALERHEGMKIRLDPTSDMRVTSPYGYDGYGNTMSLSHKAPLFKATQVYAAGTDEAAALALANSKNKLVIETGLSAPKGRIAYFPGFDAETGYMRIGDQLNNIEGMVNYSYNAYRLYATNEIVAGDFVRENDRVETPEIATKGDIRVASFNVLNLFTSDSDIGGPLNATCKDQADADKTYKSCGRGAHTLDEYLLQRTKIVNALKEMNADIVGLMEIENNGFSESSSIQYLLNSINAELPAVDAYKFIEVADADKYQGQFVGSDAITVGIFYRPNKVKPAGDAFVIATPEQHAAEGVATRGEGDDVETSPSYDKYQRYSLGQTFQIHDEKLTVVVNHLKSKGSGCLEDWLEYSESKDPADLQGKCNEFRVSAAKAIGDSIKDIEGDLLVIGDLNAYGMEDPVRVLTDYDAATSNRDVVTASWTTINGEVYEQEGSVIEKGYGLINLNTQAHGPETYSYSYGGELGNLDHALGNASLAAKLVDIQDWHINSVESGLFEYSGKYTGDLAKSENVFSSSDHDPVVVALSYPAPVDPVEPVEPEKEDDDGGSLGFFGLAMLSLLGLRRRIR